MRHEKLLIVEDDREIGKLITTQLTSLNLHVDHVISAELALKKIAKHPYGLILLDINLPQMDGLSLCRKIKEHYPTTSVILLTALSSDMDRVIGLEMGADDYICKPVDLLELELRMRALYKRVAVNIDSDESEEFIEYADFKLHPDNRTLITSSGVESRLTEAEHKVLICLISNAGKATSREKISEEIGQPDWSPNDRTVDVLIGRLRKKLNDEKDQKRIVTVRGKGYMLSL